jgi:replicative DNA helicase
MSMNASTAGLRVLRHILGFDPQKAGDALSKAKPYLTYDEDKKALDFIQSHFAHHGALPHPDTVLDKIAVFLPPLQEPFEFDMGQLRDRFIRDAMHAASDKANELLQADKVEPALKTLLHDLLPITQGHSSVSLFDFRETEQSAFANYQLELAGEGTKAYKMGLPTLDAQGGMEDGDMIGIVGRPGSGKTWLMLFLALQFWATYGEPVLFVTQEMSAKQIEKRMLPIVAGVNPTPLYRGEPLQYELNGLTQDQYLAKLKEAAQDVAGAAAPFLIYDSKMAGTVADIENIAAMHGIKRVWIDGAYMLRHPDPRLGRYARVPENLDLLKFFCQRTGASVFSSWQFKRAAGKSGPEHEEPDLDDIGYSHAIGEYMGVILGLLENPKEVSQLNKKKVSIMKGRNGEVGSLMINWSFDDCDFSEIGKAEMESDLVYL